MLERTRKRLVGGLQLALGALLLIAVWGLLPARWLPIDLAATALALLQLGAGAGLLAGQVWGKKLAVIASWVTLGCGAVLVSALLLTLSHLAGIYGPVGAGGAVLMGVIAALVLPYLVLLPALQLAYLRSI